MEITAIASGSSGNLYKINDGHTPLLLECGIPFREIQKCLDFKLSSIRGCLVTHEHMDHVKAIKDMLHRGIDCYMSAGTASALQLDPSNRIHICRGEEPFTIGTWTVVPFDVQHDSKEPLGFLLSSNGENVLYATDTYYLKYRFTGMTHIMVECNHSYAIIDENVKEGRLPAYLARRLTRSHFSLENLKEFFKANDLGQVKEIWLLHLSNANSDEALFRKEIASLTGKPVYVAQRGR